jgi:hypothetical protein
VHTLTDSPAGAKGEEIAGRGVGVRRGFGEGEEVVCVPFWLEAARVGVAGWVGADGVDVVEDAGGGGDEVALRISCVSSGVQT